MNKTKTSRAAHLLPQPLLLPLGCHAFRRLPLAQQLALLWDEGALLAERWEGGYTVELYHVPGGFYCELYYDAPTDALRGSRCFTSSE